MSPCAACPFAERAERTRDKPKEESKAMTQKEYNGWYNYETWLLKLWIDNDEGGQSYWNGRAQEAYDDAKADRTFTKEERAKLDLADAIREHFEEAEADILDRAGIQSSFWADMLGAALSEVNWYEIASHMIDDVEKEEPEPAESEDA